MGKKVNQGPREPKRNTAKRTRKQSSAKYTPDVTINMGSAKSAFKREAGALPRGGRDNTLSARPSTERSNKKFRIQRGRQSPL